MPALLLDVAVRAVLIAAGTAFILSALRIRPAATRHAAWTTVVVAMLLLPVWYLVGPRISLGILPPGVSSATSQADQNPDLVLPAAGATLSIPGGVVGEVANRTPLTVLWL